MNTVYRCVTTRASVRRITEFEKPSANLKNLDQKFLNNILCHAFSYASISVFKWVASLF